MNNSSPFTPGSRLAAYLRDSGGRDQDLSVLQQEQAIGEWCKTNGFILSRVFRDEARSGLRANSREGFLEMIEYMAGDVPEMGIVIWEYARFSRDIDDLQFYLADLRRRGYKIYSLNDQVPEGLEGRLLESIIAWKNARYSDDLRRNVRRGLRYVTTVHHAYAGNPPVGYTTEAVNIGKRRDGSDHVIRRLIPDEAKAPAVRRAFELRANGGTLSEIHNDTRLFDWLSLYGKMLTNPIYIGLYEYGDITVQDFCTPLVDQATWQAAQEINRSRADRFGYDQPRAIRSRFILTGLIRCGKCGSPMTGRVSHQRKPYTGRYDYYRCLSDNRAVGGCGARYIPKDMIESRVLQVVKDQVLQPAVLQDVYQEVLKQSSKTNDTLAEQQATLTHELSGVRGEISRLVAAIREAGHSSAMLKALAALEALENDLTAKLAQLETSPSIRQDIDLAIIASTIRDKLDTAAPRELGVILRGFVTHVRAERIGEGLSGEITCVLPSIGEGEIVVSL